MDNKEAIWRIKDHMIVHNLDEPRAIKITEALEMAIKALEQQPCDDAVSAKAVEDMLFALPAYGYGGDYISIPEFMHEFKKLSPVTPTPVWIRITDRMPESGKDVLLCDIDGDIYLGHYNSQQRYWWESNGCGDHVKNVIAWMPLPEPYKEVEEGGELNET